MSIFDIPAARLAELDDGTLRELVARLCEAEREQQGGHRGEVRWGGAQTAPDGGLDVMAEAEGQHRPAPVLPRARTGIQVKRGDLWPAEIEREMRPDGSLRPIICELAQVGGAYTIVSVGEDCSEAMLRRRLAAMRKAVKDDPCGADLHLSFVDRHALSRWVSASPSVAMWVRRRLGLPTLSGWRGHGSWSSTPAGVSDDLIFGSSLSVQVVAGKPIRKLPEALEAVRALVRDERKAVRIAGLSGIGKSRFVQALFESEAGGNPLAPSEAVYADAGHDLDPAPSLMLDHLAAVGHAAVLVIDNCPPELHRLLTERLSKTMAPVRLITVEYDVRDDPPRGHKLCGDGG